MIVMTVAFRLRPSAVLFLTHPSLPFGGDVGRGEHDDDSRGGLFLTTPGFVIRGELSLHHHLNLCALGWPTCPKCLRAQS